MTSEQEIRHQLERTAQYLGRIVPNFDEKILLSNDLRTVSEYFRDLSEEVLNLAPADDPGDTSLHLNTDLDGRVLPARPNYTQLLSVANLPRYATKVVGSTDVNNPAEIFGTFTNAESSGVYVPSGHALLRDALIYNCGKDAIKCNWGGMIIRRVHGFGLGFAAEAHADFFQTTGGMEYLIVEDSFADIPTNKPDGTRGNAGFILNSDKGAHTGNAEFNRVIVRGGNRGIMMEDKGTGNRLMDCTLKAVAFIIEKDSPRFTLLDPGCMDKFTLDDDCAVYELKDGICRLITKQVKQFSMDAWHRENFGRQTLR